MSGPTLYLRKRMRFSLREALLGGDNIGVLHRVLQFRVC